MSEVAESKQRKPEQPERALWRCWWSVDPGEKHVGIAVWHGEALQSASELTPEGARTALRLGRPDAVVIEAFSLRSPRWTNAQARQAIETIKLIGAFAAILEEWSGELVEQQPSVRHVAQRSPYWRELQRENRVPANPHVRSAVAHGLYHLRFAKR